MIALDTTGDVLPLETDCSPNRRARERGLPYDVEVGDEVTLVRDRDSELNRNAVYVRVDTELFGYLPADSAQAIGPELDSGREVRAHVAEFVGSPEPNAMRIRITSAGG